MALDETEGVDALGAAGRAGMHLDPIVDPLETAKGLDAVAVAGVEAVLDIVVRDPDGVVTAV